MTDQAFNPDESPTALFCAMETALRRGNLARAGELQTRLGKLGFRVRVDVPAGRAVKSKKEAASAATGA